MKFYMVVHYYHIILVRTVNISDLGFLPCFEVASQLKVVFQGRSSSGEGVFHQRLSANYHDNLVDLIFVRTVNIPNLSLLTCLEVAQFFLWHTNETNKPTKLYIEAAYCRKHVEKLDFWGGLFCNIYIAVYPPNRRWHFYR